MRRINPKTKKIFRRGDKEKNKKGLVFGRYKFDFVKRNGFYPEVWVKQETLDSWRKVENSSNIKNKKAKIKINPKTKQKWSVGDKRKDGLRFVGYNRNKINKDGFYRLRFATERKFHLMKIRQNLRKRISSGIKVNVDVKYLDKIFPKNFICPALGVKMSWGGGYENKFSSPSMDRIDPKKGYVEGNIVWISNKANTIKSDSSVKELEKILKWFKNLKK